VEPVGPVGPAAYGIAHRRLSFLPVGTREPGPEADKVR
jgi:hypothetical protein